MTKFRNTNSALHAFYNSRFPRIDAIIAQLKGPQFVLKNNIKLRDAVAKVGLSKIENWSGQESVETNWYNETGKETAALLKWRDAVMWFQQELFAGNIVASRLEKDGTMVRVSSETFGQDDIQHIFREHQEQAWIIFVNASDLEALLSEQNCNTNLETVRPISESELNKWFESHKVSKGTMTRDGIEKAGRQKFGKRITTVRLHNLYKISAPNGGHKRGRKFSRN